MDSHYDILGIAPEASVGLETADGRVLVPPTAFPAGEQVDGGILDACRYTLVFAPVEGVDAYRVTLEDQEGEFEPAPITRAEIEAGGGTIVLNDLFEVEQLVGPV